MLSVRGFAGAVKLDSSLKLLSSVQLHKISQTSYFPSVSVSPLSHAFCMNEKQMKSGLIVSQQGFTSWTDSENLGTIGHFLIRFHGV